MKRKNIKIKHRKYTLYQRKKSTGRKVLTAVLMVVIIAALVVVGYGVGKPLMEYFGGKGDTSEPSSAWTPPASSETVGASSEDGSTDTADTSESTKDAAAESTTAGAFILPETAQVSTETLNSMLAAAKSAGYTDIVVTLKDETGNFLYGTSIEGIPEEQITGKLSANVIASTIKSAGFTPRARINTLLDRTTTTYGDEYICYMITDGGIWHDYYVNQGGKTWLDPFNSGTAKYLAAITTELSNAGFASVTLANTRFPTFNSQDYTSFLRDLSIADDSARLTALWKVISSCVNAAKANNTEVLLEVSDEELLAEEQALTSAEPAGDKTRLKTVTLLVDYNPGDDLSYTQARAFIGRLSAAYSDQSIAVRLPSSGFSETSLAEVRRAFTDAGVMIYSE